MPSPSDAAALSSGRGRRIAIALLILLLIMLPLYLWPWRAGLVAFPWTGARPGGVTKDPRDPAALARIPGDVWDALMSHAPHAAPGSPSSSSGSRNLTMIMSHEGGGGASLAEQGWSDVVSQSPSAEALPAGVSDGGEDASGEASSSHASMPEPSGTRSGGAWDHAGPWPGGGGVPGIGPSGGAGGLRAGASGLAVGGDEPAMGPVVLNPAVDDPVAPHPTPEPGTIALVGLNVALLSRVAWKHRRNKEQRHPAR